MQPNLKPKFLKTVVVTVMAVCCCIAASLGTAKTSSDQVSVKPMLRYSTPSSRNLGFFSKILGWCRDKKDKVVGQV